MCGIGGAVALRGAGDPALLAEVAARLNRGQAHRGPDAEGLWTDGRQCALAHRRLAVIDLSELGRQPMADPSGRWQITFNGEIYNYAELRAELEAGGARFRSQSDTEVLLAGWIRHGEAWLERLDGMFALAIWDGAERTLVLARDRAGEKPLYYAEAGGCFLFASELKPLAALPQLRPALDPYGVLQYCALRYVPAPGTIFEGIRALEPGMLLRVAADGSLTRRPLFAFDRVPEAGETGEGLEDALARAVERRLVAADVPVGAFLSSGIDSSLVCALAARRLKRPVQTFCAGFGGEEDETAGAERIARHLGLPFQRYQLSADDLLGEVRDFGRHLDEPNGDRSCVPVYLLSREMRRRVTVAVSGDGGDELFCGYGRYAAFEREPSRGPAVALLERYFDSALGVFGLEAVRDAFPDQYPRWQGDFLALHAPVFMRAGWSDFQRLSVLDFHTYLPGAVLAKVDRMSMRHALEVRTPFFAPEVLSIAAGLGAAHCGGGDVLKPVLKTLLARHLPAALVSDRKRGFGLPPSFFHAHAGFFSERHGAAREILAGTRFFGERPQAFQALLQASGRNTNALWAFTALGLWTESLGHRV